MKHSKKDDEKYDFVNPLILKILKESNIPLTVLAINYMVNQAFGREVSSRIIKKHLVLLVSDEKISKSLSQLHNVTYYNLAV